MLSVASQPSRRSRSSRAAEIHQRLLYRPKEPRNVGWIQNSQVRNELTPQEKNIVLAAYDKGKVTLEDWLVALCEIVPPGRPKDLHTTKGVEQLLDRGQPDDVLADRRRALSR